MAKYNATLKDLNVAVLNQKGADHCSSHHLYLVRLLGKTREDANKAIGQMAERGIACNVHYKPLPMMYLKAIWAFCSVSIQPLFRWS